MKQSGKNNSRNYHFRPSQEKKLPFSVFNLSFLVYKVAQLPPNICQSVQELGERIVQSQDNNYFCAKKQSYYE